MACRSMVEVFDIVKEYHYLYKEGGDKHMCIAALDAFRDGRVSKEEEVSLVNIIEGEMKRYANSYIPKGNNFKVDECTTLSSVIFGVMKYRYHHGKIEDLDDLYERAKEAIPEWWDTFYEKLKLMEEL